MKGKSKGRLVRLKVLILPEDEFDKYFGVDEWAIWDDIHMTVVLRASRKGSKRLSDFIHEMKHVWVDVIDDENE